MYTETPNKEKNEESSWSVGDSCDLTNPQTCGMSAIALFVCLFIWRRIGIGYAAVPLSNVKVPKTEELVQQVRNAEN